MFDKKLRDLREADGISQIKFAQQIGFSQAAISAWENNTREPGIEALLRISRFFNVTVDYLVGNDNSAPKKIKPSSTLSREEQDLINDYRTLAPALQEMLRATIRTWKGTSANSSEKGRHA